MTNYWLIKALLLVALLVVTWLVMRPVRSPRHLAVRRLGTLLVVLFAMFAVLFPRLLNDVARALGVERGINLLVYVLVLAFFVQIATAYRRDSDTERRLTALARAIALADVEQPASPGPGTDVRDGASGTDTPDAT